MNEIEIEFERIIADLNKFYIKYLKTEDKKPVVKQVSKHGGTKVIDDCELKKLKHKFKQFKTQ